MLKQPTQGGLLEQRMTLVKLNICEGVILSLSEKLLRLVNSAGSI